jgi:hypothetical protein
VVEPGDGARDCSNAGSAEHRFFDSMLEANPNGIKTIQVHLQSSGWHVHQLHLGLSA